MEGDSQTQADLRFHANETWDVIFEGRDADARFRQLLLEYLPAGAVVIDCGCGTGHLLADLHATGRLNRSIGVDASPYMIGFAASRDHARSLHWMVADEAALPFRPSVVDAVISRLADYTPAEIARVLPDGGLLFEYGLGPSDSREIAEAFGERYTCEYAPDCESWYAARDAALAVHGLQTISFEIVKGTDILTARQFVDSIEMVPLVEDFDPERDRAAIAELARPSNRWEGAEFHVSREITLRVARKRR